MAKLLLRRRVVFDAAHHLPAMPEGHKCRRVHGHTYQLIVTIEGEPDSHGMICDFGVLKAYAHEAVIKPLDHQDLNTLFDNPTAEAIVEFCRTRFIHLLPEELRLVELELHETPNASVVWRSR